MTRLPFADEVRAVLFDLGNTLMCIDHARLAAALVEAGHAADEAGMRHAEMRARPRVDAVLATSARREGREIVEMCARLFFSELDGRAPPRASTAAFLGVWPSLWRSVPGDARPTLDALRGRGYRLAVVSNTPDGAALARLTAAGLADAFDFVVDSHEVGVEKPDPRIFAIAAHRLALPAASCVHVGDLLSVDVAGARAAGMHAVLVDPMEVWGEVGAPRIAALSDLLTRLR